MTLKDDFEPSKENLEDEIRKTRDLVIELKEEARTAKHDYAGEARKTVEILFIKLKSIQSILTYELIDSSLQDAIDVADEIDTINQQIKDEISELKDFSEKIDKVSKGIGKVVDIAAKLASGGIV